MPPAPLRLALALALVAAAAAATPAQRPPARGLRQLPDTLAKWNTPVVGVRLGRQDDGGSTFARTAEAVATPLLELLGTQLVIAADTARQLARMAGVGAVLPLFTASAGASAGLSNPAPAGYADSEGEVNDLVE